MAAAERNKPLALEFVDSIIPQGETVLEQIAEQNNGNYKFVSEQDLATLTQ